MIIYHGSGTMERYLDNLSGQYCRFISKSIENEKSISERSEYAYYDFGTLSDIDHDNKFIQIVTKNGLKKINIEDLIEVIPMID